MAMSNIDLIWASVSQLCETQALACDGAGDGSKNIISPNLFNFGDIIILYTSYISARISCIRVIPGGHHTTIINMTHP